MKKTSYPPVIVLLDLLFVFLFISIIDQKKILDISFPDLHLPKDIKVVYYDEDSKQYYYNGDIITPKKSFLLWDCKEQKECLAIKNRYGVEGKILLSDHLFNEISKLSSLSFIDGSCRSLNFTITTDDNGNSIIDIKKLEENNTCLVSMKGYSSWMSSKQ
jgi:hypothetical protein